MNECSLAAVVDLLAHNKQISSQHKHMEMTEKQSQKIYMQATFCYQKNPTIDYNTVYEFAMTNNCHFSSRFSNSY